MPAALISLLEHHQKIHKKARLSKRATAFIPIDIWIQSFLQESHIDHVTASLHDPFELGLPDDNELTREQAEPSAQIELANIALPGIGEELFLAGFLAAWLCTFVLPRLENSIRANSLLPASLLSQGKRLSLAPAVLARIYKTFSVVSRPASLAIQCALPWQYIYGWIHLHIQGAFSCFESPAFFLERRYPIVMQIYQATSALEMERIRLFFFAPHLVRDRFSVVRQPHVQSFPKNLMGTELTDGINSKGQASLAAKKHTAIAEYLISMRPGWLCYRCGTSVILEGYRPNRVARQFGYTQATAINMLPVVPGVENMNHVNSLSLKERLYVASVSSSHLLRLGTGTKFNIAPPASHTGLSYTHIQWVRLSFASYIEKGTRKYERRVRQLGLPWGQRMQHRAPRQENSDKGKAAEIPIKAGPTILSKRSRSKEPSPNQTEAPSTSERAMPSPLQRPARALRKWPSPLIRRQADEENVAAQPADIPEPAGSFIDSLFSAPSYVPQYTEEGTSVAPACYPSTHELAIIPASFQTDVSHSPDRVPTSGADEMTYQSGIHYRSPMPPNSQDREIQYHNTKYLGDLILRLNPLATEDLEPFLRRANLTLDHMAGTGMEEEKLRYWEALCRSAEYLILQVKSLGIVHSPSLLADLREQVRIRREEADIMCDKVEESTETLKGSRQELVESSAKINDLTEKIRELQQELEDRQTKHNQKLRKIQKEESHHQRHHQAMADAEAASLQAVVSLQDAEEVAENESQKLEGICHEFQDLQSMVSQM